MADLEAVARRLSALEVQASTLKAQLVVLQAEIDGINSQGFGALTADMTARLTVLQSTITAVAGTAQTLPDIGGPAPTVDITQ